MPEAIAPICLCYLMVPGEVRAISAMVRVCEQHLNHVDGSSILLIPR